MQCRLQPLVTSQKISLGFAVGEAFCDAVLIATNLPCTNCTIRGDVARGGEWHHRTLVTYVTGGCGCNYGAYGSHRAITQADFRHGGAETRRWSKRKARHLRSRLADCCWLAAHCSVLAAAPKAPLRRYGNPSTAPPSDRRCQQGAGTRRSILRRAANRIRFPGPGSCGTRCSPL